MVKLQISPTHGQAQVGKAPGRQQQKQQVRRNGEGPRPVAQCPQQVVHKAQTGSQPQGPQKLPGLEPHGGGHQPNRRLKKPPWGRGSS